MSLSILNNIAALYAENNLNSTTASLQTTLQQLSSGSRINSGADDPAGLAVSDGMNANVAALNQSATNANTGIGLLQTADGALSQVTSLLDQAVTLATEASNGTLTRSKPPPESVQPSCSKFENLSRNSAFHRRFMNCHSEHSEESPYFVVACFLVERRFCSFWTGSERFVHGISR